MSRLFRRREVWLPTVWGWLVLLVIVSVGGLGLGLAALPWLAVEAPARGADGHGARILVVEGWLDEAELAQAAALVRRGQYARVLTSGGPIEPQIDVGGWHNFALRAATYLQAHGPPTLPVVPVPAPGTKRDRTYLSAVMVRDWVRAAGLAPGAIDIFTAGPHGRRSRMLYRMAFGSGVEVGVITAPRTDFSEERWWTSSSGVKAVIGEAISLAWTACCFWPGDGAYAAAQN